MRTALLLLLLESTLPAAEPVTLENVVTPEANDPGEPLAEAFSLERATHFLDRAAVGWTKNRKCFTCHTNYAYLVARPAIDADVTAHRQVRAALEDLVETRWVEKRPRWDAEVVMSAAVLAINDRETTGKLHAATRTALDRMWTVQRDDGGVSWLKCDWPPMESDDEFGAAMMAIAVGAAPGEYRNTPAAKEGLVKLRTHHDKVPPPTRHHEAMWLWADSYLGDFLTDDERKTSIAALVELQREDGGWSLPTLGDWKRSDGSPQSTDSDGYATGFLVYVLRRSGLPADDPRLFKGVAWLKANQRSSGRWFTRSLHSDGTHYLSHAGTAFATLAITACEPK